MVFYAFKCLYVAKLLIQKAAFRVAMVCRRESKPSSSSAVNVVSAVGETPTQVSALSTLRTTAITENEFYKAAHRPNVYTMVCLHIGEIAPGVKLDRS